MPPRRAVLALAVWGVLGGAATAADEVRKLTDTLANARSYKVRLHAASVLARRTDPRVGAALARAALQDPHAMVRAYAVDLLAGNPGGDATDARARAALKKAAADPHPLVRSKAAASLASLDRSKTAAASSAPKPAGPARARTKLAIAVRGMGDRTGRATQGLRDQLRLAVAAQLAREPNVQVSAATTPGLSFVVDGAIRTLEFSTRARDVETQCAVELVVSRPPQGIVLVASGEAIVQKPRPQFRPNQRGPMEREAMEHAVRSAHENLARFLARQ